MTRLRFAIIAAVVATAIPTTARQQAPLFSARAEEVRVDVLVSDHNKLVRGLRPEDFEVRDNGVLQQIHLANLDELPVNAILALDLSASVAGERLDQLTHAGGSLLDALQKDDRAALVTFSHLVDLGSTLTTDFSRVRAALNLARPSGNTSVIDASYAGLMVGQSDEGRALIIIFSDGLDTSSWLTEDAVLDTAKRGGAVVYAVSAGRLPARTFLRDLTEFTGGSLFELASTKNLSAVFLNVLAEFRQRYLVSFSPNGVSTTGWHKLDVRVKGKNFTVKARPGYLSGS